MGIYSGSQLEALDGTIPSILQAKDAKICDYIMTDISISKIYFKDNSKEIKVLLKFTIHPESDPSRPELSVRSASTSRLGEELMVTPNHIMLRVRSPEYEHTQNSHGYTYPEHIQDSSSSDGTKIPEMLPCDHVPALEMKVGDMIPRWCGGYGIITDISHEAGKTTQLMTADGLIMVNRNIISCYVTPYETIRRLSKPVKFLSSVNSLLVSKPFYSIPKKIYKFGLDH